MPILHQDASRRTKPALKRTQRTPNDINSNNNHNKKYPQKSKYNFLSFRLPEQKIKANNRNQGNNDKQYKHLDSVPVDLLLYLIDISDMIPLYLTHPLTYLVYALAPYPKLCYHVGRWVLVLIPQRFSPYPLIHILLLFHDPINPITYLLKLVLLIIRQFRR